METTSVRTVARLFGMTIIVSALSGCGGEGGGPVSVGTVAPPITGSSGPVAGGTTGGTTNGSTSGGSTTGSTVYVAQVAPPTGYIVTPEAQQGQRSVNDTAGYRQNYTANEMMGALYAVDHGLTGKGVTVAVIDDGVNAKAASISPLSKDFGNLTDANGTVLRNVLSDTTGSHGNIVAGIIVGSSGASSITGLAADTMIANLRIDNYNSVTKVSSEGVQPVVNAFDYAIANNIKVMNLSLTTTNGSGSDAFSQAMIRVAKAGSIVISAAGNAGSATPDNQGFVTDANRKGWLFVGSVDVSGTGYVMSSYSSKAGSFADRFVVAPGTYAFLGSNGSLSGMAGTSFAAPAVTALAATILQKWPQLSGQDAASVILSTATKIGDPAIFGQGIVNFEKALSPVNPTLSNGLQSASFSESLLVAPAAVGTAALAGALSSVTVIDSFGRDFTGSASDRVLQPEAAKSVGRLAAMTASSRSAPFGFQDAKMGVAGTVSYADYSGRTPADMPQAGFQSANMRGHFGDYGFSYSYAQPGTSGMAMGLGSSSEGVSAYAPQVTSLVGVTLPAMRGYRMMMGTANGSYNGTSASGVSMGLQGRTGNVKVTMLNEAGSVLGTKSYGALQLGRGAHTVMVEGSKTLGIANGWSVTGYGSVGYTRLKIASVSLITSASALVGTRFGIIGSGPVADGVFTFGVAQPLTIESGSARLHVGTGYDLATQSLTYSDRDASLAGKRRVQAVAGYTRTVGNGSFRLGMMQDMVAKQTTALASVGLVF